MSKVVARLFCCLLLLCSVLVAAPTTSTEGALTNDDVIALVKAGLGDDVVIAKIRQTREKALDLSTTGIIKLKKSGVSQKVIAAMLGGAEPSPPQAPAVVLAPPVTAIGTPWGPYGEIRPDSIEMITSDGSTMIDRVIGRKSSTNVIVGALLWCNVPDPHAERRTSDTKPTLRLRSQHKPTETYKLVKAEANEKDRSIKLESVSPFAFRGNLDFGVDEDWIIPVNEEQVEPGLWLVTPREALKPGEYGIIAGLEYFYGFGIDGGTAPAPKEESGMSKLRSKLHRGKNGQ